MDIPFINVNGIDNFKRPKFFSTVSNSPYFKGLMLFLLLCEIITTIIMFNFKVENHWTSNKFKKLHIFFTFCFLIEFIFNFFTKPRKYFKKIRNTADFIALILSFISIYYENAEHHQNYDYDNKYTIYNYQYKSNLPKQDDKNDTIQNNQPETQQLYRWNYQKRKQERTHKSPIIKGIKFLHKKVTLFFTTLCTPRNSPFNFLDVLQSIRLIRIFYMNKYLKTEFKSFMAVTFSTFPILLIFSVFMVCFGFIGNYLYSKPAPSLFGNIFISIFTVFGISTKDLWVKNTKLINKGIFELENKSLPNLLDLNYSKEIGYGQFALPKRYLYNIFVPKKRDFGVARRRLDNFDDQNQFNILNSDKKLNKNDAKSDNDYLINQDKNAAQIANEDQKSKKSIENKDDSIEKVPQKIDEKLTFADLKQMQKTNTRLFKANTIIHNSFEYTLKKRERDSTYTVWFSVSIVTVLGTILSTFVVARITDTFTSGTENLEKKEKRKAIRSVVKLLKKYKNQYIQSTSTETDGIAIKSNPELFLNTRQFNEMINILSYLKKSKDHLKDFIRENKISISNYKPPQYEYNFGLEYYNQDYYEFDCDDNLKKEVMKRRRLIEELEIMLQFYLDQSRNAFQVEVEEEHKTKIAHLRQITRDYMWKQKENRRESLSRIESDESGESAEIDHSNITVESIKLSSSEKSAIKSGSSIECLNNAATNTNNSSNNQSISKEQNDAEDSNKNNSRLNSDKEQPNSIENSNLSNDNNNSYTDNANIKNDSGKVGPNLDGPNVGEPTSKLNEGENKAKIDTDDDSIEEISVKDYSQCDESSDSDEISEAPIQEEFECFGAARNVTVSDVEHFPPPPSTKKTVAFNPQFVRAMKIILRHLINDMERYIELESALIARLSELSHGM